MFIHLNLSPSPTLSLSLLSPLIASLYTRFHKSLLNSPIHGIKGTHETPGFWSQKESLAPLDPCKTTKAETPVPASVLVTFVPKTPFPPAR